MALQDDMKFEGIAFETLWSVPVQIDGAWCGDAPRDWRGTATSAVPLVAMSFLESSGHCEWCKSERDVTSPEVDLALRQYDDTGLDVQVNFSVGGGGRRCRSLVASPSYRPDLPATRALQTARIYRFGEVEGDPPVNLFVLFLARADVESSRKALWRVRKRLESDLAEPFRRWLTYGRTGACQR